MNNTSKWKNLSKGKKVAIVLMDLWGIINGIFTYKIIIAPQIIESMHFPMIFSISLFSGIVVAFLVSYIINNWEV